MFDEHENGQTRLGVAGEQVSLLPLPDELIPTTHEEAPTGTPCNCGVRSEHSSSHDLVCPVYLHWSEPRYGR